VLLKKAYIDARYNKNYKIEKAELEYLGSRAAMLIDLTERICRERIGSLPKNKPIVALLFGPALSQQTRKMKTLLKDEKLILRHEPGKGAWTYHLVIPGTKDIRGSWGEMKVSGTIDGYEFKNLNLAPVTDADKMISVNGTIRKAINKSGGDEVTVTMYKNSDNKLSSKGQVLDLFDDAGILKKFKILPIDEQEKIMNTILSQPNESRQEQKIMAAVKKLS